jgi:lipopolysaccharide transport system permease protein
MPNILSEVSSNLAQLVEKRELVVSLTYRQIYARYRQSVLGLTWAVLRPIATVVIFTVVFSYIAKFPSDGLPYPLFVFGALLPWTLLNSGIGAGVSSLTNQANLVAKIYFPREILPISAILASAVDFLIAAVIFVILLFIYQVEVSWYILYAVPILLIEVLLLLGLVLLFSMVNVWFRDVGHAMVLFLQFWMYLTPIIYPLSMVPERFRWLYDLNPMVGIVEGFRNVFLRAAPPPLELLATSAVASVVLFVLGYSLFKQREFQFADVI